MQAEIETLKRQLRDEKLANAELMKSEDAKNLTIFELEEQLLSLKDEKKEMAKALESMSRKVKHQRTVSKMQSQKNFDTSNEQVSTLLKDSELITPDKRSFQLNLSPS